MTAERDTTGAPSAQEILDALPAAAVVLSPSGAIVAVNRAWVDFCTGNGGDLAAVSPPADYLAASTAPEGATGAEIARGIRGVLSGTRAQFTAEYPCHGPDTERWFRVVATPLREGALVVHLDISGEYERVSRWLSATPIEIVELDPDARAVYVNEAWARTAGCSTHDLLGAEWVRPIPADDRAALLTDVRDSAAERREMTREVWVSHREGKRRIRFSISPYVDDYGRLRRITLVGMDVTRERQLLRDQAAAEERRRIGANVHDTVIQRLFSVGMALERASRAADQIDDALEFAIGSIDTSITDLRSIALAPPVTEETRLDAALAAIREQAGRALGFVPDFDLRADLDAISSEIAEHLVAVLSETLANVTRHAHATECHVRLTTDDTGLTLSVTDNGVGMPAVPVRSSGTANIAQRAELLDGRAAWATALGGGTVVTWWVPLHQPIVSESEGEPL